jgi:tetratricopeptide (TPR) repeat protein
MKRTQRRHLKENELVHTIVAAREFLESRSRQVGTIAIVVALVILAGLAVTMLRQRSSAQAERLLAEAMVALDARVIASTDPETADLPAAAQFSATGTFSTEGAKLRAALPKLEAAASAYPDTEAGIAARYHMAGALSALGRNEEALKAFAEVIARADAGSLYGRMARFGQADAQARTGQLDAAITSWKALAADTDEALPADAVLLQLARTYVAKGDTEEARKTFSELMEKHPASPYSALARTELESLES